MIAQRVRPSIPGVVRLGEELHGLPRRMVVEPFLQQSEKPFAFQQSGPRGDLLRRSLRASFDIALRKLSRHKNV